MRKWNITSSFWSQILYKILFLWCSADNSITVKSLELTWIAQRCYLFKDNFPGEEDGRGVCWLKSSRFVGQILSFLKRSCSSASSYLDCRLLQGAACHVDCLAQVPEICSTWKPGSWQKLPPQVISKWSCGPYFFRPISLCSISESYSKEGMVVLIL